MRILYIHQFFATRESSLGLIRSYEFSRRWIDKGHDVTMVTSSSRLPDEYNTKRYIDGEIDGIKIRSVRVRYSNYMGYTRRMWSFLAFTLGAIYRAVTAGKHDIVFATSTPLTVGIPGWLAAKLTGTPFVFEVRDLWPEAAIQMGALKRNRPLARIAKHLERFLYRHAEHVIALSPGMAEGVIAEGVDPSRVHVIPNCSDLDLFHPGVKDQEIAKTFDVENRFVVGYTGAIGPSNGLESQIPDAARILKERNRNNIVFLIAGEGKNLPLLRERTENYSNVLLLGAMPKQNIPAITRTADVLLTLFADVPILATNSPNKFFDALASGRPVIVNQPGWTRELVLDNNVGLAVRAGDGAGLADAIIELADNPERCASMGQNARELAEREFSRDKQADCLLKILQSVTTND